MWECGECKTQNDDTVDNCKKCGHSKITFKTPDAQSPAAGDWKCLGCGETNDPGDDGCWVCGVKKGCLPTKKEENSLGRTRPTYYGTFPDPSLSAERRRSLVNEKIAELELKKQQKFLKLVDKYKHLKPEEIIFSDDVAKETLPYPSILWAHELSIQGGVLNIIGYKVEIYSGYAVVKALLSAIYKYSEYESGNLIATAKKAAEKAKLQAIKKGIHKKANEIYGNIPSDNREPIPEDVQVAVWNRDGGKCVKCGSQEKLEYDHIIPVSKGGSNTTRNIQLLCEKCNRTKSNKIGA